MSRHARPGFFRAYTLVSLLALIIPANSLSLFLDPTEPSKLAVGSYVNYTWETFDADSGWSFFRVRLRLSTSNGHVGVTNFAQHGDEIRKANLSLAPPLDDGSYVLSAFLVSSDPGGQPNGEVILAESDSFEIFHSDTVSPSTTTEFQTSTSTSHSFTSIFQSPTFISTDSQSFTSTPHSSTTPLSHLSNSILESPTSISSTPISSTPLFQIPTTVTTTTSSTQTKPSQTAIIAGSVCGGIIFLLILLFFFVRWHRKRRNMLIDRDLSSNYATAPVSESDIEPFTQHTPATTAASSTSGSTWSKSPLADSEKTNPTGRQLQLRNELMNRVAELEKAMSLQAVTSAAENARLRAEVEWLRENQDSDWALGLTDELPPSYPDTIQSSGTRYSMRQDAIPDN
ncbi:hypothetical protein C8J56DRAFT_62567 [Mycena floridula]|nr:hypothetical protein C8J56DRAFT_62567 [Mycena floridula]